MISFDIMLQSLAWMLFAGFVFWLISLPKKDVSIVDSLWALFFIIAALVTYLDQSTASLRAQIIMILVLIWGLRLSTYITIRHWGHPEDHRYQTIRANNDPGFRFKSLYLIFALQALIAWVVALPLFSAIESSQPMGMLDILGIALWIIGMLFETVADTQLWLFKRKADNKGKILTEGLWKYSRHPNYFGEFLIWWGYFLIALSAGGYFTIISPLIMTFLLLKFSGVGLLEKTMQTRPGYESYMNRTNAFFPGFGSRGQNS